MLRTINARAYAWLYRNDRAWLGNAIASRMLPVAGAPRVDWDARDSQLSVAIRVVAAERAQATGKARCTVAWLCSALPDLRPKLRALEQLPLTLRAVREVTWVRKRDDGAKLL